MKEVGPMSANEQQPRQVLERGHSIAYVLSRLTAHGTLRQAQVHVQVQDMTCVSKMDSCYLSRKLGCELQYILVSEKFSRGVS